MYVHQLIGTLRGSNGDIDETADYFGIHPGQVRAAVAYYADFVAYYADFVVDADAAAAHEVERAERARWEREQRALG